MRRFLRTLFLRAGVLAPLKKIMIDLNPQLPPKSISELVANPDFPNSAVGQRVDIKGYIGVIEEIVKNSIKVRSAEGNVVSYNFNTLRRLYAARIVEEEPVSPAAPVVPPAPPQPKRNIVQEPNFEAKLVPIEALVHRADFPGCAFGVLVDFHGLTGVVVELVGRSLKVRSREGSTSSYNAEGLRKIYAKSLPAVTA